jgi:hypothetical protein
LTIHTKLHWKAYVGLCCLIVTQSCNVHGECPAHGTTCSAPPERRSTVRYITLDECGTMTARLAGTDYSRTGSQTCTTNSGNPCRHCACASCRTGRGFKRLAAQQLWRPRDVREQGLFLDDDLTCRLRTNCDILNRTCVCSKRQFRSVARAGLGTICMEPRGAKDVRRMPGDLLQGDR